VKSVVRKTVFTCKEQNVASTSMDGLHTSPCENIVCTLFGRKFLTQMGRHCWKWWYEAAIYVCTSLAIDL